MDSLSIELVLVVVAIVANGFFSGSEFALVSARISRLAQLREQGARGADRALALKESPEAFLATIQIAITAVGALASVVGGAAAAERLAPALAALPVRGAATWAEPVALGIVVVAITFVSLVVGELAPKAIALRDPERMACRVAPVVARLTRASHWLVTLLTASTNALLRALGLGAVPQAVAVSEEEVKYLVREGAARGVFEPVEEELVRSVFEFADTTVREIMVPRMSIVGLDVATPREDVTRRAAEIGHSRIPVYRGALDDVVGVVSVRDLFRTVARGEAVTLEALMQAPLFVPETAGISATLRQFQRLRQYLALVVDEYGAVVGLVTLEDVLEEIVGEIREAGESVPAWVTRLPDGALVFDGMTPIRDVRQRLRVPIDDSPDYTTVAGFVLDRLGAIPTPGAVFSFGGSRFTVVDMEGPRVTKVKVEREPAA